MIKFNEPYISKRLKKNFNTLNKKNLFGSTYFRDSCSEILENEFGYKNFLLTNSATSALELIAILLKDYGYSDIKLPSYTFSSTANAFLRAGYNIDFIDINIENLMVDVDKIGKLNENQLLVVVHYAGSSFDFDYLYKKLDKNINFVEDAAQGFGTKYNNINLGQIGLSGCISFHPTKNIHSGFGGMALINESLDYEKAEFILERGTDRSKVVSGLKNKYEWVGIGSSFEITEASCAILESQLLDYQRILQIRKELYLRYVKNLSEFVSFNNFHIQKHPNEFEPNYHAFYIIIDENRDDLINHLQQKGIQSYIGYVPLHSSTYSKNNNFYKNLETTDYIAERVLRLPLHTNLKIKDIDYISKSLKSFFK